MNEKGSFEIVNRRVELQQLLRLYFLTKSCFTLSEILKYWKTFDRRWWLIVSFFIPIVEWILSPFSFFWVLLANYKNFVRNVGKNDDGWNSNRRPVQLRHNLPRWATELFGTRKWRLTSAQLSNKFSNCPLWTVSIAWDIMKQ